MTVGVSQYDVTLLFTNLESERVNTFETHFFMKLRISLCFLFGFVGRSPATMVKRIHINKPEFSSGNAKNITYETRGFSKTYGRQKTKGWHQSLRQRTPCSQVKRSAERVAPVAQTTHPEFASETLCRKGGTGRSDNALRVRK